MIASAGGTLLSGTGARRPALNSSTLPPTTRLVASTGVIQRGRTKRSSQRSTGNDVAQQRCQTARLKPTTAQSPGKRGRGPREKHLDGGDHEQHSGECRHARQQSEDRQKQQDEAEGSSAHPTQQPIECEVFYSCCGEHVTEDDGDR